MPQKIIAVFPFIGRSARQLRKAFRSLEVLVLQPSLFELVGKLEGHKLTARVEKIGIDMAAKLDQPRRAIAH